MNESENFESIKLSVQLPRNLFQKFLRNLLNNSVLEPITKLIKQAFELGLPAEDVENALINLEYNEPELAFDTVAEQMYEYDIKIDKSFYDLSLEICKVLKRDEQKYSFLKELLK